MNTTVNNLTVLGKIVFPDGTFLDTSYSNLFSGFLNFQRNPAMGTTSLLNDKLLVSNDIECASDIIAPAIRSQAVYFLNDHDVNGIPIAQTAAFSTTLKTKLNTTSDTVDSLIVDHFDRPNKRMRVTDGTNTSTYGANFININSAAFSINNPSLTGNVNFSSAVSITGLNKTHVNLSNVDNTTDLNKPISNLTQSALNLKANLAAPTFTGTVSVSRLNVNTVQLDPFNILNINTGAGFFMGVATTNGQLNPLVQQNDSLIMSKGTTANSAEGNGAGFGKLSICTWSQFRNGIKITSNERKSGDEWTDAGNKIEIECGSSKYTQNKNGFSLVNNVSVSGDLSISGTVSGVTKSMVDLANVDNTSDASKPVSTATQTALDLKANLASPTFTGTTTFSNSIQVQDKIFLSDAKPIYFGTYESDTTWTGSRVFWSSTVNVNSGLVFTIKGILGETNYTNFIIAAPTGVQLPVFRMNHQNIWAKVPMTCESTLSITGKTTTNAIDINGTASLFGNLNTLGQFNALNTSTLQTLIVTGTDVKFDCFAPATFYDPASPINNKLKLSYSSSLNAFTFQNLSSGKNTIFSATSSAGVEKQIIDGNSDRIQLDVPTHFRSLTDPTNNYLTLSYQDTLNGWVFQSEQAGRSINFRVKQGDGSYKLFYFSSGQLYANMGFYIDNWCNISSNNNLTFGDNNGSVWVGSRITFVPSVTVTAGMIYQVKGFNNGNTYYSNWIHNNNLNQEVSTMRMNYQNIWSKVPHIMESTITLSSNLYFNSGTTTGHVIEAKTTALDTNADLHIDCYRTNSTGVVTGRRVASFTHDNFIVKTPIKFIYHSLSSPSDKSELGFVNSPDIVTTISLNSSTSVQNVFNFPAIGSGTYIVRANIVITGSGSHTLTNFKLALSNQSLTIPNFSNEYGMSVIGYQNLSVSTTLTCNFPLSISVRLVGTETIYICTRVEFNGGGTVTYGGGYHFTRIG